MSRHREHNLRVHSPITQAKLEPDKAARPHIPDQQHEKEQLRTLPYSQCRPGSTGPCTTGRMHFPRPARKEDRKKDTTIYSIACTGSDFVEVAWTGCSELSVTMHTHATVALSIIVTHDQRHTCTLSDVLTSGTSASGMVTCPIHFLPTEKPRGG